MKNTRMEIIIVTYNSQFWLKKTLTTLKEFYLSKSDYQVSITVVDNHSSDETLVMLKKEFSWVDKVIKLEDNHGFAYANNRAIEQSEAQYIMLLNSDIEFTQWSNLDQLVEFMDLHEECAVISPKLVFSNGNIDPACHRGEPTIFASIAYFSGLESLFPNSKFFSGYHQYYKDLQSIHTIDACSGAAMIVRQSVIQKVGLLDEQFFMYAEDLDWCKRFRQAGFIIVYYPEVSLIHHKNKSGIKSASQKLAKKTRTHFFDTMLQYYDKHYGAFYPKFVRTMLKIIISIRKGAV